MTTTVNPGVADGIALEKTVLNKFGSAIDAAFGATEAAITPLIGDEVTFGEAWLQTHATGYGLTIIDGVIAVGGSQITAGVTEFGAIAAGYLADVRKTIDTKLAAITS